MPSISSHEHLRLADGQLEALAAHQLDEHRELQLAAALHLPGVRAAGREHAQRDVADELLVEPLLDEARGHLVALGAGERGGVDADRDAEARLVDDRDRQRARVVGVGDRLADRHVGQAGERDDLARAGLVGRDAVERLGDVSSVTRAFSISPSARHQAICWPLRRCPWRIRSRREPADVRARVEVRDERLQRVVGSYDGGGIVASSVSKSGPRSAASVVGVEPGAAVARDRVDDRELDLRLARVEVEEQLVDLVDDLLDAGVGPVDLVDDEHDGQARLERLAQHEPRLRQRALRRVDEQQHAVDHRQPALDLAAEVGVAGRVDDVDLRVAEPDGRVLGEDRDPLLALEIHRVEHALGDVLVLAERAGLPEHRVDERRLAVVDVRDDRDVAQVVACWRE